jgi:hypothetical protein
VAWVRATEDSSDLAPGAVCVGVDASVGRTSSAGAGETGSGAFLTLAPQFLQKFVPSSTCVPHWVQNIIAFLRNVPQVFA